MISTKAVVETEAIGTNVTIHPFAVIAAGTRIGDNVVIHPGVVIAPGVNIGDDVEVFPGSYLGKPPRGAGATARPVAYSKEVSIGSGCAIGPNAVIYYDVVIGNNTLLGDGASVREQVRVGHHCIVSRYVTVNYNTRIGDNTRIMDSTHITGNCLIGNRVFISVLVKTTNDNVVIGRDYSESRIVGPVVEDDATIGAGACLLPGVRIGRGAFVASGALVTRDVAPNDLVMGTPARVIRSARP